MKAYCLEYTMNIYSVVDNRLMGTEDRKDMFSDMDSFIKRYKYLKANPVTEFNKPYIVNLKVHYGELYCVDSKFFEEYLK